MKRIPFYSQIVNWDNEDSGFPNELEINKWEENCCGIASLRMILDSYGILQKTNTTYWDLLQIGLERNAYCEKGWIHQGLLDIATSYGIKGKCHRNKDILDLVESINNKSICIASITKYFLGGKKDESGNIYGKGGHLIVAHDTILKAEQLEIICNHPSSCPEWNKKDWQVSLNDWKNSFSGNYIEFFE